MASSPFDRQKRWRKDMTLDEFMRLRVRQVIEEEIERSREDVLSS